MEMAMQMQINNTWAVALPDILTRPTSQVPHVPLLPIRDLKILGCSASLSLGAYKGSGPGGLAGPRGSLGVFWGPSLRGFGFLQQSAVGPYSAYCLQVGCETLVTSKIEVGHDGWHLFPRRGHVMSQERQGIH